MLLNLKQISKGNSLTVVSLIFLLFRCVMQALFLALIDIFQNQTYHEFHQALILAYSSYGTALCDNTNYCFWIVLLH